MIRIRGDGTAAGRASGTRVVGDDDGNRAKGAEQCCFWLFHSPPQISRYPPTPRASRLQKKKWTTLFFLLSYRARATERCRTFVSSVIAYDTEISFCPFATARLERRRQESGRSKLPDVSNEFRETKLLLFRIYQTDSN